MEEIRFDGTYRIESIIGSGGGGIVYKAWHTRLNKYVVIKELKGGAYADVETQRNEVEALKNVKCDYLPQVYDFISENGRVFTVMEYIEGESLDGVIEKNQRFSQQVVIKWYRQIAAALEVIHSHGIAHRDIKPANIMLLSNGNVCLIDFNAALVGGSDVRLISRSLGYASPEQYEIFEQFSNKPNSPIKYLKTESTSASSCDETTLLSETVALPVYDDKTVLLENNSTGGVQPNLQSDSNGSFSSEIIDRRMDSIDWYRSDIFSLGATMYHILTGVRPPKNSAITEPVEKIGNFSDGLAYIINKSIKLNPVDRFPSAKALSDAISGIRKFDGRWKRFHSKQLAAAIGLPVAFAVFAGITLLGSKTMASEKEEKYYSIINDIKAGNEPNSAFADAQELFSDRIDSYYALAQRLWSDGEFEECRLFIEENLGKVARFESDKSVRGEFGGLYYMLGDCYYFRAGKPDYVNAAKNYEIAVKYVKDRAEYYRDYSISLAGTGDIVRAREIAEKAQVLNLPKDSLDLLMGEIKLSEGDFDGAVKHLEQSVKNTTDGYIKFRAFVSLDEIYSSLGQYSKSAKLLENGLDTVPACFRYNLRERLVDAYVNAGNGKMALKTFDELVGEGVPRLSVMTNLAINLENLRDFDGAEKVLQKTTNFYPNEYSVPMRLALLEADRQSALSNEQRNYTLVKKYYENAKNLYEKNVKPGQSDLEMSRLETLVEQLKINGWIKD